MLTTHGIHKGEYSCSLTLLNILQSRKKFTSLGGKHEANEQNGKMFKSHFGLANYSNSIFSCQKVQVGTYKVKYLGCVSAVHRESMFGIKVINSQARTVSSCLVAEKVPGDCIFLPDTEA